MTVLNEKRKALGRGLESLLPSSPRIPVPEATPASEGVREISVELIDHNPYQTRVLVNQEGLQELADSIASSGILQPIVVRPHGERFQLIAGERRWLASKLANRTTIPAIVRQVSNQQAMEMTIIENLQREDLNPIDQALAFDRLAREFSLTQEEIAHRTGKERASVANFLRLLKLPAAIQDMVQREVLSFGHGKVLLSLETPNQMEKVAEQVDRQGLSVRQTEELIRTLLAPGEPKVTKNKVIDPNVKEAEHQLQRSLGVKVHIQDRKGRGKIVIEYASLEDFDRIVEVMNAKP